MMRFLLASTAAVAIVLGAAQSDAQLFGGGVVFCSNCSTEVQEVLGYIRQAEQLVHEINTDTNTLNTYVTELENTLNRPSSVFRDVTGDVRRIMNLAKQASMLSGFANRMIQNLNSPTGYPDALVGDWQQRLIDQNNSLGNALQQAALVVDRHQQELTDDSSTMESLQTEAMGSDGRQQTLQTIAGTNAAIGQVVQKQAGTTVTGMQAQLTYYTAQHDRQALFDKWDQLMHKGAIQGDCLALQQNGVSAPECASQ